MKASSAHLWHLCTRESQSDLVAAPHEPHSHALRQPTRRRTAVFVFFSETGREVVPKCDTLTTCESKSQVLFNTSCDTEEARSAHASRLGRGVKKQGSGRSHRESALARQALKLFSQGIRLWVAAEAADGSP